MLISHDPLVNFNILLVNLQSDQTALLGDSVDTALVPALVSMSGVVDDQRPVIRIDDGSVDVDDRQPGVGGEHLGPD